MPIRIKHAFRRIFTSPEYVLRPQNVLRRLLLRRKYHQLQVAIVLPFGATILVEEGDYIGNHLINTRCYDPALSELIWRLVQPGDVCVDVGANIGYITLLMAMRCGPRGRCVSFEADPVIYEKLKQNTARNNLGQVVILHNLAASNENKSLFFQSARGLNCGLGHVVESGNVGAEAGSLITIQAVPLDEHLSAYPFIRVVKLDVEGHEYRVLQGMDRMLREHRVGNLFFENHERETSPILPLLTGFGYQVFQIAKRFSGPSLGKINELSGYNLEPNYVATLCPDALSALAHNKGWHVF
ncbi:MAG: FkbM family methyltransferase [Verrucomicrobiota bacterium]